jgi:hypothetical protein
MLRIGTKPRSRRQPEKSTPKHPPPLNQASTAFQLCPTKCTPTPNIRQSYLKHNFASRFARPYEGNILSGSTQAASRPCATPTKPVSPSCSPYSRPTRTRRSLRTHNEHEQESANHFQGRARDQRRGAQDRSQVRAKDRRPIDPRHHGVPAALDVGRVRKQTARRGAADCRIILAPPALIPDMSSSPLKKQLK